MATMPINCQLEVTVVSVVYIRYTLSSHNIKTPDS